MYRSSGDDLKRARSGVIASVVNGEAIPVVHNIFEDARFTDLEIIPMGADKVCMRSLSNNYSLTILGEAKEFFDHFFSNIARWDKKAVPFKRGAWLRLYGIPLHEWNEKILNYVFWSSLSARLELIGSQKCVFVRISMWCNVGRNVVLLGVVTCPMILSTLISSLMITFWFIYLCVVVSLLGSRLIGVQ